MAKNKYKVQKSSNEKGDGKNLNALSSIISQNDFEGLVGFEEISSCTLLKKTNFGTIKRTVVKDGKIVKKVKKKSKKELKNDAKKKSKFEMKKKKKNDDKKKENLSSPSEDQTESKVEVESNSQGFRVTSLAEPDSVNNKTPKPPKRKNLTANEHTSVKRSKYDQIQVPRNENKCKNAASLDMSIWRQIFAPELIVKNLAKLGFSEPTEIQRLTLPAAIRGHKDIIGAAETGSGKTLAFGIPVINGILRDIEVEQQKHDSGIEDNEHECLEELEGSQEKGDDESSENEEVKGHDESSENDEEKGDDESSENEEEKSDDELSEKEEEENEENGIGCVRVIDNATFDFDDFPMKEQSKPVKPLRALIVTPTRELAIQIKGHIDAILTNTGLTTCVIVGGVASEKQERILKKGPEIVIGTPGRLWELVQNGNAHLNQATHIRYLVIDETDRMIEQGHFQELTSLLEFVNSDEAAKEKRQTFVFSATLTLVHSAPKRLHSKKHKQHISSSKMKIEHLAKIIGVKPKPKVIDVTKEFGTAQTLTEGRINCCNDDKDVYLYYLLKRYPGRTLVFCNSIDCVRRLTNLFTMLNCEPHSLHASLHQKQRFKSLERFTQNPSSLLLATDVAARGLDIPNIQHVIHYQVPRTSETYIHRSGRTARAYQEGLSILLIDPAEMNKYRQICKTLNRLHELPPFPIDNTMLRQVRERVSLARDVEKMEYSMRKTRVEDTWLKKAAEDAGIILEEDEKDEEYDGMTKHKEAKLKHDLKIQKAILSNILKQRMVSADFSERYITCTGSLVTPTGLNPPSATSGALKEMKKETDSFNTLVSKIKFKAPVKKINKKKYKGFEKRKQKMIKEKEAYKKQMEEDE